MSERVGTTEKIQNYLDKYCIGGYGYGTIGEANQRYILDEYPEFVRVRAIYRLGDALKFVPPVLGRGLSVKFGEFLQDLRRVDEYPIIDDDTYTEVFMECERYEIERICTEYKLDESVAWDVLSENDYYFEDTDGMADIYGASLGNVSEDEFVDKVREASQGWAVHYEGQSAHYAKWCPICTDTSLPSSELEVASV